MPKTKEEFFVVSISMTGTVYYWRGLARDGTWVESRDRAMPYPTARADKIVAYHAERMRHGQLVGRVQHTQGMK